MNIEVLDIILRGIVKGKYIPGEKMPSENTLSESLGVPRIAVRKAYESLQQLGYLQGKQGKGWYLRERTKPIKLHLGGDESFTAKLKRDGWPLETLNISAKIVSLKPQSSPQKSLGLSDEELHVYRIVRVRKIETTRMAVHISYLSLKRFPNLPEIGPKISSIFDYFQTEGIDSFDTTGTAMSITFPTAKEQEWLDCPGLVPLVLLETDTIDAKTRLPLQFTKILYRSDLFTFTF